MTMTGGGLTFDDFLRSIGIVEPQTILSFRRVIAWKLDEAIRKQGITRTQLAARLRTRPADIELFFDTPETHRCWRPQSAKHWPPSVSHS